MIRLKRERERLPGRVPRFVVRPRHHEVLLVLLACHVFDQIDDTVRVTIFVVIPRDELDERGRQLNASLGIENRAVRVGEKVARHDLNETGQKER